MGGGNIRDNLEEMPVSVV
jgi:hypothetical protein